MTAARFGLRRTLAFLPRIDTARQFAVTLSAMLAMLAPEHRPADTLSAGHVHGRMTSLQRELVLDRLHHPRGAAGRWSLTPAACPKASTCPAIDAVLFGSWPGTASPVLGGHCDDHRPGPTADQ
jgi:hypothetical protein